MDLNDLTPKKFFQKCTYNSDPNPGNKIVVPNGDFIQSAILLNLINKLEQIRIKLE